jgi:hypothetical protein
MLQALRPVSLPAAHGKPVPQFGATVIFLPETFYQRFNEQIQDEDTDEMKAYMAANQKKLCAHRDHFEQNSIMRAGLNAPPSPAVLPKRASGVWANLKRLFLKETPRGLPEGTRFIKLVDYNYMIVNAGEYADIYLTDYCQQRKLPYKCFEGDRWSEYGFTQLDIEAREAQASNQTTWASGTEET